MAGGPALAQSYRVEVVAPGELGRTLRQGLNLVRQQSDPGISPERFKRLLEEAEREAREVAATEGYFSARVSTRIDDATQPRTVHLVLEPGERTLVTAVEIRFRGPATGDPEAREALEQVREGWRLRAGEPFRQAAWEEAKRVAVRALARWRYAAASVAESQALVDPKTRGASLSVELDSGTPFRFGPLRVSGNRRYPDAVIENLSPVRAGETYDRDKLILYQRRLLETGYFASVQMDIDAQPHEAQGAPLRIAVLEAPSQNVETGIGYTTDAGPRLELRYGNQDVRDSAWRFKSALALDEKVQNLQLNLDLPPRPGARWNSLFGHARQTDIQNESTRQLAVGLAHNFGREVEPSALIVSGHLEEQSIVGQPTDNRQAVYFGFRRTFSSTDDFVAPRSGYLGSFELGGAPPELSTRQFLRAVASASLFFPLGRLNDLLLRGQAGSVIAQARTGIPTSFLFRTGGDQTVRGYAFESLGVHQGEAIVGGRRLIVGSAELIHWVGENWGVAAFVDAGNAWDEGVEFNAAVGAGIGARFRTPIGPIRADLAYGEEVGSFRLHFSVGYSF
ncbi:MAG: putative outer membrane protein putative antigen [Burkholderiales bacterium]|nr:putative outer membrane protein putative antigen [Burkholderiales bacterium]